MKTKQDQSDSRASLSFKLRTLISNVVGMLELAEHTDDVEERTLCIRTALLSSRQAVGTVNQLLSSGDATTADVVPTAEAIPAIKILLAEDNVVNQRIVSKILENRGHEVVIAPNGQLAVELATSQKFDVILMDIRMPIMGGLDATSFIRSAERSNGAHRVPIIAISAVDESELEKVSKVMDDVIQKPFNTARMVAKVEALAGNPQNVSKSATKI